MLQVHVRTYACEQALSCTCGVAVRENNEAFILDMCSGAAGGVRRSPTTAVRFAPGVDVQRGEMTADSSGRTHTVSPEKGYALVMSGASFGSCASCSASDS